MTAPEHTTETVPAEDAPLPIPEEAIDAAPTHKLYVPFLYTAKKRDGLQASSIIMDCRFEAIETVEQLVAVQTMIAEKIGAKTVVVLPALQLTPSSA